MIMQGMQMVHIYYRKPNNFLHAKFMEKITK